MPRYNDYNVLVDMKNLNILNVKNYIEREKKCVYSLKYKEKLDVLLERFIDYRNRKIEEKTIFSYIKAPEHIWHGKYLKTVSKNKKILQCII